MNRENADHQTVGGYPTSSPNDSRPTHHPGSLPLAQNWDNDPYHSHHGFQGSGNLSQYGQQQSHPSSISKGTSSGPPDVRQRRKVAMACGSCRHLKIRCSEVTSPSEKCVPCARSNIDCHFFRVGSNDVGRVIAERNEREEKFQQALVSQQQQQYLQSQEQVWLTLPFPYQASAFETFPGSQHLSSHQPTTWDGTLPAHDTPGNGYQTSIGQRSHQWYGNES